jgi:hypothetical protein
VFPSPGVPTIVSSRSQNGYRPVVRLVDVSFIPCQGVLVKYEQKNPVGGGFVVSAAFASGLRSGNNRQYKWLRLLSRSEQIRIQIDQTEKKSC